jgi:hypothetical protein
MAKKTYQSKASREQRLAQNKGVKHGTVRTGAGGRSLRRYDSKTGRWNVVRTNTGQASRSNKTPVRKPPNISPPSSNGSGRTSSAHDSFIADQGARGRSPLGRARTQAVTNSPVLGQKSRLQKTKSGQMRWVKVI